MILRKWLRRENASWAPMERSTFSTRKEKKEIRSASFILKTARRWSSRHRRSPAFLLARTPRSSLPTSSLPKTFSSFWRTAKAYTFPIPRQLTLPTSRSFPTSSSSTLIPRSWKGAPRRSRSASSSFSAPEPTIAVTSLQSFRHTPSANLQAQCRDHRDLLPPTICRKSAIRGPF